VRRVVARSGVLALALVIGLSHAAAAAASPKAVPGATYVGKGAVLEVDAAAGSVRIRKLPIHADCRKAPANQGDYGSTGIGPFAIAKDGTFTNVASGTRARSDQTVIEGRFAGRTVTGTIVEPALRDDAKGFDCKRFSGTWKATRKPGTGDDSKPGATYATDDFSKVSSGFDAYNEAAVYAEYLPDARFRIGFRSPSSAASLRKTPETATADIQVTTGYTRGSGLDGAGLACLGTDALSYIAGYVDVDGTAHLSRYSAGEQIERADPVAVPAGLLKTGDQAQNEVRLVCTPDAENPAHTDATLFLNGRQVLSAIASAGGTGQVGVFANSSSGDGEFTFAAFSVKKPRP